MPNVTLLHWAQQPWWCKAVMILPVPRTQDHVVEVFQGDTANAGVRTDGRGDCGGGAHHSSRAVEVWSAVEV